MIFTLLFGDFTFPNQTFEVKKFPMDNNIKRDIIPRRHGAQIQEPFLKARRISIEGLIHNNVKETTHDEFMALQKGLLASEAAFQYRSDRFINCFTERITTKMEEGTDMSVMKINVNFIAKSPFFLSTILYSVVENVSGVTTLFDVFNGGDVFSRPVISINATGGTINDNIQLENVTNDQLFKFRGIVADGTTVEIDSDNLTVLNNFTDGLSVFQGDFLTILAGTNQFRYIGDDCRVTVEYRYRWY